MQWFWQSEASAEEREKIKARTTGGRLRAAIAGGKPQGPTVLGYAYNQKQSSGASTPTAARWCGDDMYKWAASGMSCRQIANKLEQHSVKPPRSERWRGGLSRRATGRGWVNALDRDCRAARAGAQGRTPTRGPRPAAR